MELDDLKLAWQSLDRRLAEHNSLALHTFRDNRLTRAQSLLRPLVFGQVVQLLAGVGMSVLFAPFWVEHLDTPHLMLSGLLMHAYALMFIVFAARDLHALGRVDYAAPVLDIQKDLARLRSWRARVEGPVFAVTGCFIWIPLVLILFRWLGVDVWAANPQVVYWFLASGFACLGLVLGLRSWARRPGRESLARAMEEGSVGQSLRRAERMLEDIARFERE